MTRTASPHPNSPLGALLRFAPGGAPLARCDLCGAELGPDHPHLVEPRERKLVCACDACSFLLSGRSGAKYRRLGRSVRYLADFHQTDAQWDSLGIPIGLAFFFHSSPQGKVVALYPSPAGPTESRLDLAAWSAMIDENPSLREMQPDVEALLVDRIGAARDYYLVPIDVGFRLTGLIRLRWRGFSGGADLWAELEKFFAGLKPGPDGRAREAPRA